MSRLFRLTLYFLFRFNNIFCIYGQSTYYYKLTKKIEYGTEYTNTAGGQFITFSGNRCFDSDKFGKSVGNGELVNTERDNANSKNYMGNSYFGKVIYRFKPDLSVLNIIVNNSLVYVYKRQNAPAGVTTCSLIREPRTDSKGGDYEAPAYPPNGGYDGGGYNNGNNTGNRQSGSSHSQNSTASSTNRQPTKHTCPLCNGKKRIVKDTYPPLYGMEDYKVRCNECGGYFMRSTGHTHITCPQCHGKGYFTTD